MTADRQKYAYNFAYLDERTRRMIRRALRKGVAVPGNRVPDDPQHGYMQLPVSSVLQV